MKCPKCGEQMEGSICMFCGYQKNTPSKKQISDNTHKENKPIEQKTYNKPNKTHVKASKLNQNNVNVIKLNTIIAKYSFLRVLIPIAYTVVLQILPFPLAIIPVVLVKRLPDSFLCYKTLNIISNVVLALIAVNVLIFFILFATRGF